MDEVVSAPEVSSVSEKGGSQVPLCLRLGLRSTLLRLTPNASAPFCPTRSCNLHRNVRAVSAFVLRFGEKMLTDFETSFA